VVSTPHSPQLGNRASCPKDAKYAANCISKRSEFVFPPLKSRKTNTPPWCTTLAPKRIPFTRHYLLKNCFVLLTYFGMPYSSAGKLVFGRRHRSSTFRYVLPIVELITTGTIRDVSLARASLVSRKAVCTHGNSSRRRRPTSNSRILPTKCPMTPHQQCSEAGE
jgi:hypothetical protein